MQAYRQAQSDSSHPRQKPLVSLLSAKQNQAAGFGPVVHPDLGIKIYDPGDPGPDEGCSELDVNEETQFAAGCMDSGDAFDLYSCTCDSSSGGGGGGGEDGNPPPDVTIVAWVNGSAITLPGGANIVLQGVLQNANAAEIAACAVEVSDWVTGNRGAVITYTDQQYASAWLLKNSANSPPPDPISPSALLAGADYRLFNDNTLGTVVGSTADPCKTGNVTGWGISLAGDYSRYDGNIGISPSGQIYQVNEGQVGLADQAVNLTLNGRSTPWIWSVIEFDIWGDFTGNLHAMFPTYSVYVDNNLVAVYPQSAASDFIAQGGSYQLVPSQIP